MGKLLQTQTVPVVIVVEVLESAIKSQLAYGDLVDFSSQEIFQSGLPLPVSV